MRFLKEFREKHMQSNFALAILSVIIAVFVWLIISLTQYPDSQKTIEHIPFSRDISGSVAESSGLSIMSSDVEEVTVELLGSKLQVGNLNNENLVAYIDADSVTTAGTRNLTIKIKGSSGINYEIKSIKPATANVVFDKTDTREFTVYPKIPKASVVDGKAIDENDMTCDPSVVRITGPSSQLDKIAKCYAVFNKELSLDRTTMVSADELELYTEDNTIIDQSALRFSETHFDLTVPVLTQKEVQLFVSIIDAPENFDTSIINFDLSNDTVVLACNNSLTEIPDKLDIGKVSLSELKKGFTKTFQLSSRLEGTDYENISNIEAVTVTFNDSDFTEKPLILDKSRINLSNAPDTANYKYEIQSQRLEITLMGPEDVLAEITPEDIAADIDLLNANITSDSLSWNAKFSCKYDNVWVVTNSQVSLKRTKSS